jgi:hypothetical protein
MARKSKGVIKVKASFVPQLAIGALLVLASAGLANAQETSTTWEGLELTKVKGLDTVYMRPKAQIAAYKTVQINPSRVEFSKGWERHSANFENQPTADDMQRIKTRLAELVRETFAKELKTHGYAVLESPAEDTLLVSASIINLYIDAPNVAAAGRAKTYTTGAGKMTLVLELRDAPTGQLLARVIDEQIDNNPGGRMEWANAATNEADARRIIEGWATRLRKGLDGLQGKESK